ncbi:MAG: thiamine pyrophosphate-dependent enzyme, partial [Longimicrobiaceae bacterium]
MTETKTRKAESRAAPPETAPAPEPKQKSDEERLEGFERDQLRQMMHDMLLARRFEEKAAEAYALGKIGGFCHLYIGQEAVAVGAIHALRKDDYVMTAYREHVHALQTGVEAAVVMAELY